MTLFPLCRRQGGPQGRSGWVRKISPLPVFFCILLYSVHHPYFVLCLDCPSFCLLSLLYNTNIMTPAGFETATPASDRPQTLALDRSATGIGKIRSPDRPVCSLSVPTTLYVCSLLYIYLYCLFLLFVSLFVSLFLLSLCYRLFNFTHFISTFFGPSV